MRKSSKHLDFEVNLIPCIDLLSVCICFLLLTAVWLNVGSMNVKQAVGGQAVAETEKKPLVWVFMSDNGDLNFNVQETSKVPPKFAKLKLAGIGGHADLVGLSQALSELTVLEPGLKTALIQPQAQTAYEDIIGLMDEFKKKGLIDLGVVPL